MFCGRLFKKKDCSDECPQRVRSTESKSKASSSSEDEEHDPSSAKSVKSEDVLSTPSHAHITQEPKPQSQPAPPPVVAPKAPEKASEPSDAGSKTSEKVPRGQDEKRPQVQLREQVGTPKPLPQTESSTAGSKTSEKEPHKKKGKAEVSRPTFSIEIPIPVSVDSETTIVEVTDEAGKGADKGPQGIVQEPQDARRKGPNRTGVEIIELDTNEEKRQAPGTARKT